MSQETIVVLNGSHSELPLIQAAARRGLRVVALGNQAIGVGHRYADARLQVDYRDAQQILRIVDECGATAIASAANDWALLTASFVSDALGLPGYDRPRVAQQLLHKDSFRRLCSELEVASPRACDFSSAKDALSAEISFPVIVKPIDSGGGRGISRADTRAELTGALERAFGASRSRRVVIEEFVEGQLHSLSAIIQDQRVVTSYLDAEYTLYDSYAVSTSMTFEKGAICEFEKVVESLNVIAGALSLTDGLLHAQFISTDSGPKLVEVTRRIPGDLHPWTVEMQMGLDWSDIILEFLLGHKVNVGAERHKRPIVSEFVGRHCVSLAGDDADAGLYVDRSIFHNLWHVVPVAAETHPLREAGAKGFVATLAYGSLDEMQEKTSRIRTLISTRR